MMLISTPNFFFTFPGLIGVQAQKICASWPAPSSCHMSSAKITASSSKKFDDQSKLKFQSGNYQPLNWDFNHVLPLEYEYTGEKYRNRSAVLKDQVRIMLDQEMEVVDQLELIDNLQRLGLSYHFEGKIRSLISGIYNRNLTSNMPNQRGLYATALEFRLLRQYGFEASQEIFYCFKDESGDFKSSLCEASKGMLYLYEASYLEIENESDLEMAREFTAKNLKKNLEDNRIDKELAALVEHALEVPLHWRMMRLEARWFIDKYEKRSDRNPILLELAKLDFDIVQATYRDDLKYALRWWRDSGLADKLAFARDIMVENFFWTIGFLSDPQHGYGRRMVAKIAALITAIDDVYDDHGTLDELELFTCAVGRWDVNSIDQLPEYMKICYLALYNCVNEMAYDVLKDQGVNIIPYLRKAWADLCKAYLQEAKWCFSSCVPTLQEYLDNAWISISGPLVLVHSYFCVDYPVKKEVLEYLDNHKIIHSSAMILRLANDLGTSPASEELKGGDVPKSIECHMKETGASEEKAREYIKFLIIEAWKQMNGTQVGESPFSPKFNGIAMNLTRMGQCMYQHGDGHGYQNSEPGDRILALLFEPISSPSLT